MRYRDVEDFFGVGSRLRQRARARLGHEIGVAKFQRHRFASHIVLAQPGGDRFGEIQKCFAHHFRIVGIFEKGRLVSDRLRFVMRDHFSRVDTTRELQDVVAVFSHRQTTRLDAPKISDRATAELVETLGRLRPDTPESFHREGSEKIELLTGCDNDETVGLIDVGGNLREKFVGSYSNRSFEPHLLKDVLFDFLRKNLSFLRAANHRDVDKSFVYRKRLDEVAVASQDRHDALRDRAVLLHVSAKINALRTKPISARYGHRGIDSKLPRFIGRGRHHSPPRTTIGIGPHNDRLPPNLRMVPLLHRRVERVHIYMQDQHSGFRYSELRTVPTCHSRDR